MTGTPQPQNERIPEVHEPSTGGEHSVEGDNDSNITSVELLRRVRAGDRDALNELFARHFPIIRRWAHARLPRWARNIAETADLVQDVMLNAFRRLDAVEVRRRGALQAYLRQAIQNRIRDEFRSFNRHAPHDPLDSRAPGLDPSPLDLAIDAETKARYTKALSRLRQADQELLVGRLELGYSYEQLAVVTGRRSAEAVRVALRRTILKLADEMNRE